MENKINFICLLKFHSNKKEQDYFQISYVMNHKPVTEFISEELFNKFSSMKLVELKEYTGVFALGSNRNLLITDIK